MKKTGFTLFVLLLVAFTFITSCELEEGDIDNDDLRNDYVGEWKFTETSSLKSTHAQTYIVTISKDPANSSQILLENFSNPGVENSVVAGVLTSSQIIVTKQTLSNGWEVAGSGKGNAGSNMTWTYSIIAGGDIEYYTATAVKQQ